MQTRADLTRHELKILTGLRLASKPNNVDMFREHLGDELLEGLVSKDWAYVDNDQVVLSLQGVRALLDFEGLNNDGTRRRA